jgi:hypothetical protein
MAYLQNFDKMTFAILGDCDDNCFNFFELNDRKSREEEEIEELRKNGGSRNDQGREEEESG